MATEGRAARTQRTRAATCTSEGRTWTRGMGAEIGGEGVTGKRRGSCDGRLRILLRRSNSLRGKHAASYADL